MRKHCYRSKMSCNCIFGKNIVALDDNDIHVQPIYIKNLSIVPTSLHKTDCIVCYM